MSIPESKESVEIAIVTKQQHAEKNKQQNSSTETTDFKKMFNSLQQKSRDVRNRIQDKTIKLQEHAGLVKSCPLACEQNDIKAQLLMSQLPVSRKAETNATPDIKEIEISAAIVQNPAEVTKSKRKTRKELQDEVDALQELVNGLTLRNPELESRVLKMAKNNPVLAQLPYFRSVAGTETPCCSRNVVTNNSISQPEHRPASVLINGKTRHESDVSTASSVVSQNEPTVSNTNAEDVTQSKRIRRRGGRGRKKSKVESTATKSERDALIGYINQIVQDYLGSQSELAAKLEFNGDFADLEAHAQVLVKAGIGRIVEDEIRVNRKNNRQSFITMSNDREGLERDGIILLPVARRYAFEGDIVRAFVMNTGAIAVEDKQKPKTQTIIGGKASISLGDDEDPFEESDSQESGIDDNDDIDTSIVITSDDCPKSFVISIVKQTELRQIVGTISFKNPTMLLKDEYYKLKPHDMRVPMVYVPKNSCAKHITDENKNDICGFLYLAHILETDANGHCIAELLQPVGKVGNIEAEIKAILLHNGLKDILPYEQRFNDLFAQPDPPISEADMQHRQDLRKQCVFTIDPLTARDLDDAVSIETIAKNEFEVGVHISDVAYYLLEDSELDNIVKERATSIYLVNEVIHMLPKPLCFKCSLLPGEDKFAFSVFWRMNALGEIIGKPRFSRTIINSCTQFAYEHAQKVIDNPNERFGNDDFPTICNGFTPNEIAQRILLLHGMAKEIRKRRFDDGAMSINNPKIRFSMDPKTGEPLTFAVEALKEANFLIEEFMLLANQAVARFIYDHFPNISILRNHAPPLTKSMKALRDKLANLGFNLDYSSSKAIQESMHRICKQAKDSNAMNACLSTLLMKPMARAKYFCTEGKSEGADLWHYALSIPIYTHFTSPIRRYPDILVHRLLAASLEYCPPPKRTVDELHQLAKISNDRKYSAKTAGDESVTLFFKRYIRAQQGIILKAVVIEIFQHMLNVVTIETGHVIAINYKMQKVWVDTSNAPSFILISETNSKLQMVKLEMMSTIKIKLCAWDNKFCGFFVSPDPMQRQINSNELAKKKHQQQLLQLQQQQKAQQQQLLQQQFNFSNNNIYMPNTSQGGHGKKQTRQRRHSEAQTANNKLKKQPYPHQQQPQPQQFVYTIRKTSQ